ncbi:unnamed protein product [Paramecium sonneborni]|uniref:Uncharacterized protein n=1 Tax=Paramecium sonneborni TaxID=65129 RepID=A0A8S1R6V2_9CILI|nr:unnamed protein product [Paramecium sonneborni]
MTILQKQNQLISTSQEGQIHIWTMTPIAKPIIIKKFDAPSSYVSCLIYNESLDLIITGSNNNIHFWKNPMRWLLVQSINEHEGAIWALSINQNENKLISCDWDRMIIITGRKIVLQKVFVEFYGYRPCFIDDDYFMYQLNKGTIILFQILDNGNEIQNVKEIELTQRQKECNAFFRCDTIIILKLRGQEQIQIVQFIYFDSFNVFEKMNDDSKLLATWDESSKKIQIRKLVNYQQE